MRLIITEATRTQLGRLTTDLARVTEESTRHRNGINQILSNQFGDTYSQDADTIEFFDKHVNNVGTMQSAAMLLQAVMPKLDERSAGAALQALDVVSRWNSGISDKPRTPDETRAQAMTRTLTRLDAFISQRRGEFNNEQHWKDLHGHLDGLRESMLELRDLAESAQRLRTTISPGGASLASSA